MDDQWTETMEAVRSSDPDRVTDAIDRIGGSNRDERAELFDFGFDDLTTAYDESDDGYVRQSVVRVVEQLAPGLADALMVVGADDPNDDAVADLERRLDTTAGFLLETIQDEDGRVRQSTKRALKDVYRCYEMLEETETIATLATELENLAEEYEDKRQNHILESMEDAAYFRRPAGSRAIERIRQLGDRSDDV